MARTTWRVVVCLAAPCLASACAADPASNGGPNLGMARRGAAAGMETFDVAYRGMGGAIEAPLRDFNFAHERIPATLRRAVYAPYDMTGLETCGALTGEIVALDLALGPDLDTPDVERTRDIYARGASLAADAALDAVRAAATGYVPMRSVIRQLSGAQKLEKRIRRAQLAGSVRRGFLKAIGMERGCGWPAAPLGSPVRLPLSPAILARLASPPDAAPPQPDPTQPDPTPARPLAPGGLQLARAASAASPATLVAFSVPAGSGSLPVAAHTLLARAGER